MDTAGFEPPRRRRAVVALLGGLAAVIAAAYAGALRAYIPDDAYITFRVAQHLVAGHGAVFNPGEHVEVTTSPLWLLVSAAILLITDAETLPLVARLLGALFAVSAVGVGFSLASALVRGGAREARGSRESALWLGTLAALLLAVNPDYTVNALSGLETGMLAFLVTAALAAQAHTEIDGRFRGAGVLWGLAALARPEVILFAPLGALLGVALMPTPTAHLRVILVEAACFIAIVATATAIRVGFYDGELLPNTYWAKQGGGRQPPIVYLWQAIWPSLLGAFGLALAAAGWVMERGRIKTLRWLLHMAMFLSLPLLVGSDWMIGHRFLAPYLPALAVVVMLGWMAVARRLTARALVLGPVALAALAGALLIEPLGAMFVRVRAHTSIVATQAQLADWLCGIRDDVRVIAMADLGLVGHRCPGVRIIDITGLADRTIGKSPGGHMDKHYDPAYVLDQAPDVVVLTLLQPRHDRDHLTLAYPVERRLFEAPAFAAYRREAAEAPRGTTASEGIASLLGAEIVFFAEPAYEPVYRLAAFRRPRASP